MRDLRISQRPGEPAAVALLRAGLLACSPQQPSVAISLGLIEFYHRLRRHAPRLGVQPFVRALCDKYMVRSLACCCDSLQTSQTSYRPYLREQVAAAFDAFLAIQREVQRRVDSVLEHDAPHFRVKNSCACCNYKACVLLSRALRH